MLGGSYVAAGGRAEGGGAGARRLRLQLDTGAPCWGVVNMTGAVQGWSFADGLPHSAVGLVNALCLTILAHSSQLEHFCCSTIALMPHHSSRAY